jgi:hypothetical protein
MRQTARIESLSYGTIYMMGCIIALFLSLSRHTPVQTLILHTVCSWGYVIFYVLRF